MSNPTVRLEDIAKMAGVSPMTVSRVLTGKAGVSASTRAKVLEAVENSGYVPNVNARALAGSQTRVLGMIVPDFSTQYISELARGAGNAAVQAGYELVLYTTSSYSQRTYRHLTLHSRGLIDGLVVVLPEVSDAQLDQLKSMGLHVVIVDPRHELPRFPSVHADNYRGARLMMDHLVALGHQRIGFITGRTDTVASFERLKGYREGLQLHGLKVDDSLIIQGNFLQTEGVVAAKALMAVAEPPTAIFASNDMMALGAMDAVRDLGYRIPEDISIGGFDDIPMASHLCPALTTVRQPLFDMGATAARMIINMLSGIDIPAQHVELRTELVVRNSTAVSASRT